MGVTLPSALCTLWLCLATGRCQNSWLHSWPGHRATEEAFQVVYYDDSDDDPPVVYQRSSKKKQALPRDRYILDISGKHLSYNRSIVRRTDVKSKLPGTSTLPTRAETARRVSGEALSTLSTNVVISRTQGSHVTDKNLSVTVKPSITELGSPTRGRAPTVRSASLKWRRLPVRATGNWKFEYKRRSVKQSGPWGSFHLSRGDRRESRRGRNLGAYAMEYGRAETPLEGSGVGVNTTHVRMTRSVRRTAVCLLVACCVLLTLLLLLVLVARWLRSKYRNSGRSQALYSTLSGSDADLRPIVSRASLPPKKKSGTQKPAVFTSPKRVPMGHSVSEPVMSSSHRSEGNTRRVRGSVDGAQEYRNVSTGGPFSEQTPEPSGPTSTVSSSELGALKGSDVPCPITPASVAPLFNERPGEQKSRKTIRVQARSQRDSPSSYIASATTTTPIEVPDDSRRSPRDIANTAYQEERGPAEKLVAANPVSRECDTDDSLRRLKGWMMDESQKVTPSRESLDRRPGSVSEDYQQYSDSDEIPAKHDMSSGPLPSELSVI